MQVDAVFINHILSDMFLCQGAAYRETDKCLPAKFGEA